MCAGRSGQILNYSSLANDCGIAVDPARRWDAFDQLAWWSRTAEQDLATASLVYGGDQDYTRREVAVRPWFAV